MKPNDIVIPRFLAAAVEELLTLSQFAAMVRLGFTVGSQLAPLLEQLARGLGLESEPGVSLLRAEAEEFGPYAASEANAGFTYVNSLLAVRLLTILESVVDEAVVDALRSRSDVLDVEAVRKLKGPLVDFMRASDADRSELLAEMLSHETKATFKTGVGKFEALLEIVGLGGGVDEEGRRGILELTEVRNVVVHRRGRVDSRFLKMCPWLDIPSAHILVITSEMFERYRRAVGYYLLEVTRRWVVREGHTAKELEPFLETLERERHSLRKSFASEQAG